MTTYDVELTTDPAAFLAAAEAHLAATRCHHGRRDRHQPVPRPAGGRRTPADRLAGVVGRRPGHRGRDRRAGDADRPDAAAPVFVLPMPDGAALALARALHARGESVGGLNGSLPSAEVCAAELARLQGDRVEVAQHTRLFELGELLPPVGVPGRLRTATVDDLGPGRRLGGALHARRPTSQAGRDPAAHGREVIEPADLARRIEGGTYWFWLDEAVPGSGEERVHLTGASPPAFGVARVGPVYTPPEHRRKGYAGAAVAEVSQHFLDAGARVCLYTDQANPTSNGIYQALGYVAVVDQVNLRIVDGS
jgi:GNAT superfamily N-acetyltransferase